MQPQRVDIFLLIRSLYTAYMFNRFNINSRQPLLQCLFYLLSGDTPDIVKFTSEIYVLFLGQMVASEGQYTIKSHIADMHFITLVDYLFIYVFLIVLFLCSLVFCDCFPLRCLIVCALFVVSLFNHHPSFLGFKCIFSLFFQLFFFGG